MDTKAFEKEISKLSFLYELSHLITSTLEPEKILNLIVQAAVDMTRATSGSLSLIDQESQTLNINVSRGYGRKDLKKVKLRVGEGVTGWVAKTGEPLLVSDVTKDERYVNLDKTVKSELAVPLTIKGETIGVVNVNSDKINAFGSEDLELLSTLADHSASVIHNAMLYETANRRAEELALLFGTGKIITGTLNLEDVLAQIVEKTSHLMKSRICSLMLLNEDGTELSINAVYGGSSDYIEKPNLKVEESLIGRVIKTKRPLTAIDVFKERGYKYHDLARREGLRSLLSVPLMVKGEPIGAINIYKPSPYVFTSEEVQLLSSLADQAAIAIENAKLYKRMVELEEQARRAEKVAVLGELAVEITHEIRNPLTIIKMLTHTLAEGNRDDEAMEVIKYEIDRIDRLVARFLDYARPAEPKLRDVDMNHIVENTLLLVNHRINRQGIRLAKDLSPLPRVSVDPEKMTQVLLNLLINAVDAMPTGGELILSTRADQQEKLLISIKDSGTGIPQSIRERLFSPFVTTKKDGLGLGLSIVHRIIEQHDGKIEVDSQEGKGTTFTIELPLDGRS